MKHTTKVGMGGRQYFKKNPGAYPRLSNAQNFFLLAKKGPYVAQRRATQGLKFNN